MRNIGIFKLTDPSVWRMKALYWADSQKTCAYTNPNSQFFPYGPVREILAAGNLGTFSTSKNSFSSLRKYHTEHADWLFGYFGYNLKNEIEPMLNSKNFANMDFPDIFFFRPEHLLFFTDDKVEIHTSGSPDIVFEEINATNIHNHTMPKVHFHSGMVKEEYIEKAIRIIRHIEDGDIYELNLCMEFLAKNINLDPVAAYHQLIKLSPTPFSGFLRFNEHYLISASPERFLQKTGKKLLSQPIKGTAKRGESPVEDEALKDALLDNEKERAENMMIVDLVRNDLARSAEYGTVKVDELFGIYSFRQWHQMISSVSATAREDLHWTDIIKNAFPMGSMTGAPKIKVMELIEKYENSQRTVYSGAFGFVTPQNDFDFNVVIRSLIYDSNKMTLSFQVGSALTYDADPEQEYDECLLKASAIFQLFN